MTLAKAPHAREIIAPACLCAGALALALALSLIYNIKGSAIVGEYYAISLVRGPLVLYIWVLVEARKVAFRRAPLRSTVDMLKDRWVLFLVPMVITPAFMTAFTTLKCAFPLITGYRWDATLANLDYAVFGQDPWQITHALVGSEGSGFLALVYTAGWGLAVAFAGPLYTLWGDPKKIGKVYTAKFLTWLVCGVFAAALFSSAGPIFAGTVDPSLAARFAPLHTVLNASLATSDPVLEAQKYLAGHILLPQTVLGGGISAMPSMHLGICAFLVLLAGRTWWRWPALILTGLIWFSSIHFGYHYAVDGLVAFGITRLCWNFAFREKRSATPSAVGAPALATA